MTAPDWSKLAGSISEARRLRGIATKNPAQLSAVDQNDTAVRNVLEDEFDLDLGDPTTVFTLMVGAALVASMPSQRCPHIPVATQVALAYLAPYLPEEAA